ncbi:MAG: hypothetical protein V7K47_02755 [Nostoc sp.]
MISKTKKVVCTASAILAAFWLQSSSVASEKFVNVGVDDDGNPFLLDTTTMGDSEKGFGSVIKVYQQSDNLMTEVLLQTSCGDDKLWIVGARVYSSNGVKLSENKQREEISARGSSPGANAIRYYCQSIGARGW